MSFRPVHKSGGLTTTQAVLYTCPDGFNALVVNVTLCNTDTGNTRTFKLFERSPGDQSSRLLASQALTVAPTAGNDWSLGSERWILTPGMTLEGLETAGSTVDYALSILEIPKDG